MLGEDINLETLIFIDLKIPEGDNKVLNMQPCGQLTFYELNLIPYT